MATRDWNDARACRKAEALLPWSYEPHVVYGDAAAGLGDRKAAIAAYRRALNLAPDNWVVWLRLANASLGKQRVQAYRHVHKLNPLETGLPAYVYRTTRSADVARGDEAPRLQRRDRARR